MAADTRDLFSPTKKLFLLDGMALTYRAHFALIRSPRYTSDGQCTSAVFGMLGAILDILAKEQPSHIACAFDTDDPTQRHVEFPEYKAQRDEMPEDLASQLPLVDRLMDALNIKTIRMPGYEADDIIGTLSKTATAQGFETWMVTPDKDFHQLVSENAFIYKPGRRGGSPEILRVPEVLEQWEIKRVDQVIDVLGLMGDSSDNIPGIPGIGPKTAKKLIAQFDTLEGVLDNADKLKGKQRERVEENKEQALLSKRLVTIQVDVPDVIELDSLERHGRNDEKLRELLMELEFETVGKRLFGKTFSVASARASVARKQREAEIQQSLFDDEPVEENTIDTVQHTYRLIDTPEKRNELRERLNQQSEIAFNFLLDGHDARRARPIAIAFCGQAHEADFVPLPENFADVLAEFAELFGNAAIAKIGHHLKRAVTVLKWNDVEVAGKLVDTVLLQTLTEHEMQHDLESMSQLYLNYRKINASELLAGGERGVDSLTEAEQLRFACECVDVTYRIAKVLHPMILERGFEQLCDEVECPLVTALVDMEFQGITLDIDSLAKYSEVLQRDIDDLQARIFAAAGHRFNVDSPKQLGVVLFDELKLEAKPKKTSTGQYSTREAEVERLSSKHQIIADILDYRNARKLKSTYVDQLPHHVDPDTGRLHTHYLQTHTATGRMQSDNPNLQTIPVRKERGREIRASFVPRDEHHTLLSADYSQIELRIMADLSGDEGMLEAFQANEDIHTVTASKVFHVEAPDVTREMRSKAKMVNFGIIYGITSFGLQQRLNISRAEATDLIENYFEKHPGVRRWIDETIAFAKEHGYVATKMGRRRYLRDITSRSGTMSKAAERLAMNSPIQGTAADMLKLAIVKVHGALQEGGFQTKMLLTVHDELVFDMVKSEAEAVMPVIEAAMKDALPMSVPVVVEMGTGENWLAAH